jgi:FAD/FMN-containing dehydrogenase
VTSYYLVYDDLGRLMSDSKRLMEEQRFDYVESWASPLFVGLRTTSAGPAPVIQWFYPLHLSFEHDAGGAPSKDPRLDGLGHYRHAHTEEQSTHDYIFRCEPLFAAWKHSGHWQMAHPWMELTLPWDTAQSFIETALAELSPRTLGEGRILLWPALSAPFKKPLFPMPPGDTVMGFGILGGMPAGELPAALRWLGKWSDLGLDAGGRRYVSGWLNFTKEKWAAHFGAHWPTFCALKAKYDPRGILAPGVVDFEAP